MDLGSAFTVSPTPDDANYLVANIEMENAESYGPEINFYLRNNNAAEGLKSENVKRLYQLRRALFEHAQDNLQSIEVGKRVLLISSSGLEDLADQLEKDGFTVMVVEAGSALRLEGRIGRFRVALETQSEHVVVEADQVVWQKCPENYLRRKGVHDPDILGPDSTLESLLATSGQLTYSKRIKHDSSLCLQDNNSRKICRECVAVCPVSAVRREENPPRISISDIECIGCGSCAAVCPTGAMDSTGMPRSAFAEIRRLFRGRVPLILPSALDLANLNLELDEKILPLVIEGESILDECHMLSLIQSSGYPVVYYSEGISRITENIFSLINSVFDKIYRRKAIVILQETYVHEKVSSGLQPFENVLYEPDERSLSKREIMAIRLEHLVGKGDYGTVYTGPLLHYGVLRIEREVCTLCLSCAAGCKPGALSVHPEDNTLRFTPTLCTCCTNCSIICPEENCLDIILDQLVLHSVFFQERVMARDELFSCVECGTGFAPVKSITKITEIMKPRFGSDAARIKTLHCCPDCKAKVMLEKLKEETI